MEAIDIFHTSFVDDDGKVFRFITANNHLNVVIDGKPFFEFDLPFKLVRGVRYVCDIYDCIQSCNGEELKIFHKQEEDKWIAMIGEINANLQVID